MNGILINIHQLHKITKLLSFIKLKPLNKKEHVYLLLIIPIVIYNKLHTLTKNSLLTFVNSDEFTDNIQYSINIIYNYKLNICEITNCNNIKLLPQIITIIYQYLPKHLLLWININQRDVDLYLTDIIKAGFMYPYKCTKTPLGYKIKNSIAFIKSIQHLHLNKESILNKLTYINEYYPLKCKLYAKFTPECIRYFKTVINEKVQKEVCGTIYVSTITKHNNKIIFVLNNTNVLQEGKDEEVNAIWSRYNFHTHPKNAYVKYNIKYAWPSSTDYIGFLTLNNHTIFHTLVAVEGLYIISIHEHYNGLFEKIDTNKISTLYNIPHSSNITPDEYIIKINNIKYKNKQLFTVQYLNWKKCSFTIFPIFYNKTNNNCYPTDETFNLTNILDKL